MALNVQVWQRTLMENFFPDDSFTSKSVDDSIYVTASKVHIPNAGKPSKVQRNRASLPTDFTVRQDQDLEYNIDELTTDPIRISNRELVELSYDKRSSILRNDCAELQRVASVNILERWANGYGAVVKTTGVAVKAHTHSGATGNRKQVTRGDILRLMTQFNSWDLPAEDRYLLLDSEMHAHLLGDLSESDKYAFYASADAKKGIVGKIYGFNVMTRSSVLRVKADGETLLFDGEVHEATECAGALAWHEGCVSRAMGEVKMYSRENDPLIYGDGYSFLMRVGGSHRRHDKIGVALLVETAA